MYILYIYIHTMFEMMTRMSLGRMAGFCCSFSTTTQGVHF